MSEESTFFAGLSELFAGAGVPLLLSLCASCVRFLKLGWRSWRHLIASVMTSIFVGQTVYWGLTYFNFDAPVDAAIVSLSAYMGGSLLDAVVFRIGSEIKNTQ